MSLLNWLLNCVTIFVVGLLVRRKYTMGFLAILIGGYSVLYLLGFLFHTDALNAVTVRPGGVSVSFIGIVLLALIVAVASSVKRKT